jgi:hypothetical protein
MFPTLKPTKARKKEEKKKSVQLSSHTPPHLLAKAVFGSLLAINSTLKT